MKLLRVGAFTSSTELDRAVAYAQLLATYPPLRPHAARYGYALRCTSGLGRWDGFAALVQLARPLTPSQLRAAVEHSIASAEGLAALQHGTPAEWVTAWE